LLNAEASPVVTSSIFALKNAAGDDWRDKQEVEHSGKVESEQEIDPRKLARAVLQVLGTADLAGEEDGQKDGKQ
jgi:hypothetical protein